MVSSEVGARRERHAAIGERCDARVGQGIWGVNASPRRLSLWRQSEQQRMLGCSSPHLRFSLQLRQGRRFASTANLALERP